MIAPPNCIAAIDVSAAQGTIDGARIAAAGIALAWVEIGVGNDRPNACRAQQVASLRAAGIRVRPYGFAYALPPDGIHLARDPVAQVALWLNEAEGLGLDPYEPWEDDAEWPAEVAWARWGDSAGLIRSWHLMTLRSRGTRSRSRSGACPLQTCLRRGGTGVRGSIRATVTSTASRGRSICRGCA